MFARLYCFFLDFAAFCPFSRSDRTILAFSLHLGLSSPLQPVFVVLSTFFAVLPRFSRFPPVFTVFPIFPRISGVSPLSSDVLTVFFVFFGKTRLYRHLSALFRLKSPFSFPLRLFRCFTCRLLCFRAFADFLPSVGTLPASCLVFHAFRINFPLIRLMPIFPLSLPCFAAIRRVLRRFTQIAADNRLFPVFLPTTSYKA